MAGALAASLALAGCGGSSSSGGASAPKTNNTSSKQAPDPKVVTGGIPLPDEHTLGTDILTITKGETKTRGGVNFKCESEYPCTVTLKNNAGKVTAQYKTWGSVGSLPKVTASAATFGSVKQMNLASPKKMSDIAQVAFEGNGGPHLDNRSRPDNRLISVGPNDSTPGFGSAVPPGSGPVDHLAVSLTGKLNPGSSADVTVGGKNKDAGSAPAALALAGWKHRVLFKDWGDTAGAADAGFETAVLIYSDIERPKRVKFADLEDEIVDGTVRNWFTLGDGGFVVIDTANTDLWAKPVLEAKIDGSNDARLKKEAIKKAARFRGAYFGAAGRFECTTARCSVSPSKTGRNNPYTINSGTWSFTPDADATVTLPDQDWMTFGVWVTVPDDEINGVHRVGVFHKGMESMPVRPGLVGKATYNGGAAGVYVDHGETGLFTAQAVLNADFSSGFLGTLRGRIDKFKDSQGRFLGEDAVNNDWSVVLKTKDIKRSGVVADGKISGDTGGVVYANGEWSARFYGPGYRTHSGGHPSHERVHPTGVIGNFRATTGVHGSAHRSVIGAFGAKKQ